MQDCKFDHVPLLTSFRANSRQCTRPFTLFRWKADRTARTKRTIICLTCARLKNCCQCCMLDLSFGLPIAVRDAALKMVAPGPQSAINREYYAQEHEKEIEEGRGAVEAYEKTDEKARELLRRLAHSEPYYKKQRRLEGAEEGEESEQKKIGHGPGPIRTSESRLGTPLPGRGGGNTGRARTVRNARPFPSTAQLPPGPEDYMPPADKKITSLFVTGVEDDLPEHALRTFFSEFGQLRSLICSHRSHCAFINFATRESAEKAIVDAQERDKREKKEYRRRKTVERKRTSLDLWPTANHRGRRHPGWKGRRRHPYRAMGRRAQTLERAPGVQPEDGSGEGGVDWGALHPRGEIECARGGLACC